MACAMAAVLVLTGTASSTRLNRWNRWWETHLSRIIEDRGKSVESQRHLEIQQRVLAHMQAAERGLRRAETARDKAGLGVFAAVLGSLRLSSLDQVDNLKTLQEIVVALETAAPRAK
jgi:hypothetical protein